MMQWLWAYPGSPLYGQDRHAYDGQNNTDTCHQSYLLFEEDEYSGCQAFCGVGKGTVDTMRFR
jgi:hypothetical protein